MAHLPRAEWIARRARSIAAAGVVIHDANLRILLLDATAVIATRPTKAELRAAVRSFEHATRSKIRADRQHAGHLRHAAKQLFRTTSQGDGEGVAILLSSLALLAIAAATWHNARSHEQQTSTTHQVLIHLQTTHDHAASRPLADLTRRTPHPKSPAATSP